mmetsp:Transcript_61195/g.197161  ORF Transcript_61195/g.197161 Transcript_61195/m.197161 type:complete len:200 (-) Transcript_61195:544-1143(-)
MVSSLSPLTLREMVRQMPPGVDSPESSLALRRSGSKVVPARRSLSSKAATTFKTSACGMSCSQTIAAEPDSLSTLQPHSKPSSASYSYAISSRGRLARRSTLSSQQPPTTRSCSADALPSTTSGSPPLASSLRSSREAERSCESDAAFASGCSQALPPSAAASAQLPGVLGSASPSSSRRPAAAAAATSAAGPREVGTT